VNTRKLDGDIGCGVSSSDDQNLTRLKLPRVAIVSGMQLFDRRVKVRRECRCARLLVVGHGYDDIFGFEPFAASGDKEVITAPGYAVDSETVANGKVETARIGFQIVGQLLLRGERIAASREWEAGKFDVPRGREKTERIPAIAPCVANAL